MKKKIITFAVVIGCLVQSLVAADNNYSPNSSKVDLDQEEVDFSLSLFDVFFDIKGILSRPSKLNFSLGLLPRIDYLDRDYSITSVFAIYDIVYKFYNDPDNVYTREVNIINSGLIFSWGDYKKGFDISGNLIYTEPKRDYTDLKRLERLQLKFTTSFHMSTRVETHNYIPRGIDFNYEFTYFLPGALCTSLYFNYNEDIFCTNKVNEHKGWKIINSSNFKIKSIVLDEKVSDYTISKYCLSSMFTAYPGVCDINRFSLLFGEKITILSPYFSNGKFAWYLSMFIENGLGLFGEVGRKDWSKSAFRFSHSIETGFRVSGLTNIYARFTYFIPKNPSIQANFYFSINLG